MKIISALLLSVFAAFATYQDGRRASLFVMPLSYAWISCMREYEKEPPKRDFTYRIIPRGKNRYDIV